MTEARPVEGELERYLRRLRYALRPLPSEEREEIVREVRSHFLDRVESSGADRVASVRSTAQALGPPEEYARTFVRDYRVTAALTDGSGFAMLYEVVRLAGSGMRWLVGLMLFLIVFGVAVGLVVVGLLKLVFPESVGLWYASDLGVLGMGWVDASTAAEARELLGYWIVPLNVALGVLLYRVGTVFLGRFLGSVLDADGRS